MPRKHNPTRLGVAQIKHIPYKHMVTRKPKYNKQKEDQIIKRLKRTGQITIEQYKRLFGEEPYLSPELKFFRIVDISSSLRTKFDNIDNFRNGIYIYHESNIKTSKDYHNYTNIDNIIKFKEKHNIDIVNIHFDDENINRYNNKNRYALIKADGVITNGKNYYFIETDMGTEHYETMVEKDENYIRLIKLLKEKDNFKNYKVILYTSKARIMNFKDKGVFKNLDNYNLIEYYPN